MPRARNGQVEIEYETFGDGQPDGRAIALVRLEWRDGERTAVRLADQHPHGNWLEWLAD